MRTVDLPVLGSAELLTVRFDFSGDMAVGETITGGGTTVNVYSGTDATPQALVSGGIVLAGQVVEQDLDGQAAVVGTVYLVLCTITTSSDQQLSQRGFTYIPPTL